jgi:hypothetical protein
MLLFVYGPALATITANLSMAYYDNIYEDHGGEIWFPNPAAGTITFWIKRISKTTGLLSQWQRISCIAT